MAELTLEAALRDCGSNDAHSRNLAVRSLAPAYLESVRASAPVWNALRDDAGTEAHTAEQVVAKLVAATEDPLPQVRALALVGMGTLGLPELLDAADTALALAGEDDADVMARECAVIGLSFLGAAAVEHAPAVREAVLERLDAAMRSPLPDLRFQAGFALLEVEPKREPRVLQALEGEHDERVRANLVRALATLDPPGPDACEHLSALLESEDATSEVGYEAALALTAARRPEGGPRLLAALARRDDRDRALEALAVLGPDAPPQTAAKLRRLADAMLEGGLTRVRAAYALARVEPAEGEARLAKLERSLRPSVREGVADARANLERLRTEGG